MSQEEILPYTDWTDWSREVGFHEKAGQVKIRSGRFSQTSDADQREACEIPASIPNYAIAESPRFHPHSWVELFAPVPAGVLNRRVLPSRNRTALPPLAEACVPSRRRSHPNSTICNKQNLT
jgi:hypothetical protein